MKFLQRNFDSNSGDTLRSFFLLQMSYGNFLIFEKIISMKQLLLIATFLVVGIFNAQEGSPVVYTDVVKVSDSTKSAKELYSNAKMWFTKTFKNPKNVIVLDEPENNIIVGRGNTYFTSKIFAGSKAREGYISFKVTIATKNGRYKYEINEFISDKFGYVTNGDYLPGINKWIDGSENFRKKVAKEVQDFVKAEAEGLISSMYAEMNSKSIKNDDW